MNPDDRLLPTLGFLRSALLAFALLNLLPPLAELLMAPASATGHGGMWAVISGIVAPVMAPLLAVVLLFDYIMSRVRAADAEGAERARFVRIGRIELAVIAITMLFWIPYFISRLS